MIYENNVEYHSGGEAGGHCVYLEVLPLSEPTPPPPPFPALHGGDADLNHRIDIDRVVVVWLGIGSVETFFPIPRSISPMVALSTFPCSPGTRIVVADRRSVVVVASPLHTYCLPLH